MKIIFLILGILILLPMVSALDQSLPIACAGDDELIIACGPADENLTFLSRDVPSARSGIGGGGVVIGVEEEDEEPEEEKVIFPLFSILGLDKIKYGEPGFWGIILVLFMSCVFLIFIYRKKKKKKQAKKLEENEKEKV